MKKSNFAALIMGTVSGLLFALGMCMALLPEWDMFTQGVIFGVLGAVLGIIKVFIWRKMEKKPALKLNSKTLVAIILGVLGALALGLGLCMCLVWEVFVIGILVGILGIVILLCIIPVVYGLK